MRLRRGEDAVPLIECCLTLGREQGYRHFFFWPRHAVARVCLEALTRGIHVDDAVELIDKGQLPAPLEAADVERWPWPLKIFTLGRFSILVHGTPLRFEGQGAARPAQPTEGLDRAGRARRCRTQADRCAVAGRRR